MSEQSYSCVADATEGSQDLIVAFASMEGDMVDQHFGSSQGFYVYCVNDSSAELVAKQSFAYEKKDGNEDKLKPKMKWLVGSDVVYCGSIGGSATKQLISLGITPFKVKGGPDVEELIEDIQLQLSGEQEFWLKNILSKKTGKSENRFADFADNDWEE